MAAKSSTHYQTTKFSNLFAAKETVVEMIFRILEQIFEKRGLQEEKNSDFSFKKHWRFERAFYIKCAYQICKNHYVHVKFLLFKIYDFVKRSPIPTLLPSKYRPIYEQHRNYLSEVNTMYTSPC